MKFGSDRRIILNPIDGQSEVGLENESNLLPFLRAEAFVSKVSI
jgi:hypothetical protein